MTLPERGDWVRASHNGRLVLGVVEYIVERDNYPYEHAIYTDQGVFYKSQIREVRKAPKGDKS